MTERINETPEKRAFQIICENISLGYNGNVLLKDVNLTIGPGVFMPFVGPNGSGKTTLIRAILGLLKPLKGQIITPFDIYPPGYVSQHKTIDFLYPVSVLDIVMMGSYKQLGWRGKNNRDSCYERAVKILTDFGLKDHMTKTFDQLSGGMRQKTIVARALAGYPDVLIMDEPTTELDHKSQKEVIDILYNAAMNEGRTVLMVHHGLSLVSNMASEVCLVYDGEARILPIENARF